MLIDYDDDYPTCVRTYASLRILHDDLEPDRVTRLLGIEPSESQVKGAAYINSIGREKMAEIGGWFLSTEGVIASRDLRRHVDCILDKLVGKDESLKRLQADGNEIDVFCYWLAAEGHGGPTLSPAIMRRLGELEIEIGFDIYG